MNFMNLGQGQFLLFEKQQCKLSVEVTSETQGHFCVSSFHSYEKFTQKKMTISERLKDCVREKKV